MSEDRRFTLGYGASVSLAIHACFVLAIAAWVLETPRAPHRSLNQLKVEVRGKIAKRQTAAHPERIKYPLPEPVEPKQESKNRMPDSAPKKPPLAEPLIPQTKPATTSPEVVQLEPTETAPPENSNRSKGQAQAGAEAQQPQQAIVIHSDMNDRIAAYIAQLSKHLQSNLIYPQDAKKKKIEGTSRVSFVITESGEIQPNTLVVKKSSGSADLDSSALRTVASSVPFQKPPRELNVSVDLEFEVDSKIF